MQRSQIHTGPLHEISDRLVGPLLGDPPTDLSALDRYWSPTQLVAAALTSSDRLAPDTRYRYCNTDYILLGLVIEQATGQRVDAQLWQRIVKPLCLHDTTLPTVDPYLRGPHAKGYLRSSADTPYVEISSMTPSESWTAGAIVATALDVAAFLDGLLGGALLPPAYLARMSISMSTAAAAWASSGTTLAPATSPTATTAACPATPAWPCGPNPDAALCCGRTASTCTTR
jgi:D-alanyl-D-alanine carboxypeptidase